jgi:asparagine synthase (glutamine-hydrolysing)
MSILTGLLHDRGALASEPELRHLSLSTQRYATGLSVVYARGRLGMSLQPYLSHERSALENGPRADIHGNVLSFDGRIDNYAELADQLDLNRGNASDSEIVLAAFERWGEECFTRLTGDWAIALWSERAETLSCARSCGNQDPLLPAAASSGPLVYVS